MHACTQADRVSTAKDRRHGVCIALFIALRDAGFKNMRRKVRLALHWRSTRASHGRSSTKRDQTFTVKMERRGRSSQTCCPKVRCLRPTMLRVFGRLSLCCPVVTRVSRRPCRQGNMKRSHTQLPWWIKIARLEESSGQSAGGREFDGARTEGPQSTTRQTRLLPHNQIRLVSVQSNCLLSPDQS